MNSPRLELGQQLRHELQLSQSLGNSLAILRMSGPELCAALSRESEQNPFLSVQFPAFGDGGDYRADEVAAPVSWRECLLNQCRRSGWSSRMVSLMEVLVHQLDAEGYLQLDEHEISAIKALRRHSRAEIREAKANLLLLQPIGMGAADLRERLLTQLADLRNSGAGMDCAQRLLKCHFAELSRGNLDRLCEPHLGEALELISTLSPRPADSFATEVAPQAADLAVRKSGSLWRVHEGPGLGITASVAAGPHDPGAQWNSEAKARAGSLWSAANSLSQSIAYRKRRLLEIAQVIVDFQKGYFERGPEGLRPLRLADLARETGLSATTASLTVRGKTIASPRGFHELKYLIPRSFSKTGIAREIMKGGLSQTIACENPQAPMSDSKLADSMRTLGAVSRRGVAQLRAELGIPSSYQRKSAGRRSSGEQHDKEKPTHERS